MFFWLGWSPMECSQLLQTRLRNVEFLLDVKVLSGPDGFIFPVNCTEGFRLRLSLVLSVTMASLPCMVCVGICRPCSRSEEHNLASWRWFFWGNQVDQPTTRAGYDIGFVFPPAGVVVLVGLVGEVNYRKLIPTSVQGGAGAKDWKCLAIVMQKFEVKPHGFDVPGNQCTADTRLLDI